MGATFIKIWVRLVLSFTSREKASRQIQASLDKYRNLAALVSDNEGTKRADTSRMPNLPGIDEDMKDWSFFMILEHNTIVNRAITATVTQLVNREPLHGDALMDPKHDVVPRPDAGRESFVKFEKSVLDHLHCVKNLGNLKKTATSRHPVFGQLNAHRWNNMYALHLHIHLNQADLLIKKDDSFLGQMME